MQIFKATNPPGTAFNNQDDDDDDGSDDILLYTYNVPIVVPNGLNISLHLNLLAWYDLHFPFYKSKKKNEAYSYSTTCPMPLNFLLSYSVYFHSPSSLPSRTVTISGPLQIYNAGLCWVTQW